MPDLTIPLSDAVAMLIGLLNTPSPTGYTREATAYTRAEFEALNIPNLTIRETKKGALLMTLSGKHDDAPRAVTAHVDTLGAMVKEIKNSGRLKLTMIGGSPWTAVEYEGVTIRAANDARIRGTIVPVNGSTHVNKDVGTMPRNENTLEVRLDARTASAAETRVLGIQVGDFVFFDPRVEINESGFIRSRHLDDKLCVACVYAALIALRDADLLTRLPQTTHILISNYEEVGHGGAADMPADLDEMLVVDMAAMGDGQASTEFDVTLCVKDSSGAYHFELNEKLRRIALENQITLKTDIYPYYGSDGSAYWRAGGAAKVALIGPGVDSSHGYERSHVDSLEKTARLLACYLVEEQVMDRITLFGLIISIGGLIFIIELVRRGKLREDYSLLWLGTGVIMVLLILSRPLVDELARLLGVVTYPPAALFVVAIIFMLFILLQYSTALTRLSRDNKKIAQEMALLRQELTAAKTDLAQAVVGEQAGGDQGKEHGAEIQ